MTRDTSLPTYPETFQVGRISLRLARPIALRQQWIGDHEILRQLLACWLVVDPQDNPLSPRIVGQPGVGKTTLAMAATQERKQDLFIYQCTSDTRPEDLLVSPVIAEGGTIIYQASPLVTAMLTGNVCLLDEGNRMNEKSWASLASLLDHRRLIESVVAGVQILAHEHFRCCVTMNEDASTYEVPDYILSRLQPTLKVEFPSKDHELAILQYHLPFAPMDLLNLTVDFLQKAHQLDLPFSVRDGIHIVQYGLKRMAQDLNHPLSRDVAWREALKKVLGEEALDLDGLAKRRAHALGGQGLPKGLGDFFFDEDSPLHPDH
jgi:MoxR-like ATPase